MNWVDKLSEITDIPIDARKASEGKLHLFFYFLFKSIPEVHKEIVYFHKTKGRGDGSALWRMMIGITQSTKNGSQTQDLAYAAARSLGTDEPVRCIENTLSYLKNYELPLKEVIEQTFKEEQMIKDTLDLVKEREEGVSIKTITDCAKIDTLKNIAEELRLIRVILDRRK